MKYLLYTLSGLLGVVIFVSIAQISQNYSAVLSATTTQIGLLGVVSYIGITISAIVAAPLGTGFLLPVAANSFGPFWAATYSVIGWLIGSLIAFSLARTYGQKYVKDNRLVIKLQHFEQRMPPLYFIGILIALRMILPVDLMSYALGLGSSISYRVFLATTLIGITPFAFLFTYSSVSSVGMQVLVSIVGSIAFLTGIYWLQSQYNANKTKNNNNVH